MPLFPLGSSDRSPRDALAANASLRRTPRRHCTHVSGVHDGRAEALSRHRATFSICLRPHGVTRVWRSRAEAAAENHRAGTSSTRRSCGKRSAFSKCRASSSSRRSGASRKRIRHRQLRAVRRPELMSRSLVVLGGTDVVARGRYARTPRFLPNRAPVAARSRPMR